jgi:hypothetical protein
MSDPTRAGRRDRSGDHDPTADIETYDVDGGVVFFDAENPLAWVEANMSIRLTDVV